MTHRTLKLQLWMLVMAAMVAIMGLTLTACEPAEGTLPDEDGDFMVTGTVTLNTETIEGATVVAFTNDQEVVDDTVTNDQGKFVLLINEDKIVTVIAGAEFDDVGFIASEEAVTSGSMLDLSLSEANTGSQPRLNCWQAGCWWRFVYTCCDAGYWGPICSWGWGHCN